MNRIDLYEDAKVLKLLNEDLKKINVDEKIKKYYIQQLYKLKINICEDIYKEYNFSSRYECEKYINELMKEL